MATLNDHIESVSLESLKELKERWEGGETLSPEENAKLGEFMRMLYLEEGENILLLNGEVKRKKGIRKNGELTFTYIVKCQNSKGIFDLWITSFDSAAFVTLYNKKYRNEQFNCRPKCISLDDINAVGTATQLMRESANQLDFIFKLIDLADEEGKVRIMVKRHQVGETIGEATKSTAEVAVQYNFNATDTAKPYTYKENGKTLFEIDLVD